MENRKRRITVELKGQYLEGMEQLSNDNFRQLKEQIMAILQKELLERGLLDVERNESDREVVMN